VLCMSSLPSLTPSLDQKSWHEDLSTPLTFLPFPLSSHLLPMVLGTLHPHPRLPSRRAACHPHNHVCAREYDTCPRTAALRRPEWGRSHDSDIALDADGDTDTGVPVSKRAPNCVERVAAASSAPTSPPGTPSSPPPCVVNAAGAERLLGRRIGARMVWAPAGLPLVRADAEGEGAGTREDRKALAPGKGADAEMDAAHARRMLMRFEHASTRECRVAHRAPRARRSGSESCTAWRSKSVILYMCMAMHIGYSLALSASP
jgi:hypothetical protein